MSDTTCTGPTLGELFTAAFPNPAWDYQRLMRYLADSIIAMGENLERRREYQQAEALAARAIVEDEGSIPLGGPTRLRWRRPVEHRVHLWWGREPR